MSNSTSNSRVDKPGRNIRRFEAGVAKRRARVTEASAAFEVARKAWHADRTNEALYQEMLRTKRSYLAAVEGLRG